VHVAAVIPPKVYVTPPEVLAQQAVQVPVAAAVPGQPQASWYWFTLLPLASVTLAESAKLKPSYIVVASSVYPEGQVAPEGTGGPSNPAWKGLQPVLQP
jgi:hypothetical protein